MKNKKFAVDFSFPQCKWILMHGYRVYVISRFCAPFIRNYFSFTNIPFVAEQYGMLLSHHPYFRHYNYTTTTLSDCVFCWKLLVTARKRSLGQGNIFRSVCQEFCPQGVSASTHPGIPLGPGRHPPHPLGTRHPPTSRHPHGPGQAGTPQTRQAPPQDQAGTPSLDQAGTPPPSRACWEIRSTSGRYASYWNAILF